ncbi:MAG: hypothetical protein ACD_28C00317G0008 [uncultured bacterium]|nr:MAG: hypothetical protein ACD_28C00317G0008 [uncultured bacterium]KKT72849.1 MAG: 3-phosphoshikimate 1-carboxyvinyltransferase [Candidatus Peregrinibacteria bacterium GW2011_GWA2_44_7]
MSSDSISVPGSKSLTNRALLMASLAKGTSHLNNVLQSEDTDVMREALEKMGVALKKTETALTISSTGEWHAPQTPLFLNNAGTAVRFLTAILSHQPFTSHIEGNKRMQERPLRDLLNGLESLGAQIESQNGCPPLTIHGKPLSSNHVVISGNNSSQYVSALLMLAPLLPDGLTITIQNGVSSKPYIDMTLDIMNKFFIQGITRVGYEQFTIPHQPYQPTTLTLEADASSATYFWGLAALNKTTIEVRHLSRKNLQADLKLLEALESMGCRVQETPNGIAVTGPTELHPLGEYNANNFPDGAMTLAVLCAFAKGKTRLKGLHNLRIKESDRLHALATELSKIGAYIQEHDDGLTIEGNPKFLHGATISTYNDHRVAMAFGMAGCRVSDMTIENPDCVKKTYPNFWNDLRMIHKEPTYPHFSHALE